MLVPKRLFFLYPLSLAIAGAVVSFNTNSRTSCDTSLPLSFGNVESLTQLECVGSSSQSVCFPSLPDVPGKSQFCAFMCAASANCGDPLAYYVGYHSDPRCTQDSGVYGVKLTDYNDWWGSSTFFPFSGISNCCEMISNDVGACAVFDYGASYHMMLMYSCAYDVSMNKYIIATYDPGTGGILNLQVDIASLTTFFPSAESFYSFQD